MRISDWSSDVCSSDLRLDPVDAEPPGLDHALVAQAVERLERALAGALEDTEPFVAVEILRDVVDEDDLDAVGLQAFQAVLDGAQGRVGGIVVHDLVGPAMLEEDRKSTRLNSSH